MLCVVTNDWVCAVVLTTGVCRRTAPRTVVLVQTSLKVWIDQDLCTGDGLCVDHAPDVFVMLEDGIAYVSQDGIVMNDPGGAGSLAVVPSKANDAVIAAAELCPGECIFIELGEEQSQQV